MEVMLLSTARAVWGGLKNLKIMCFWLLCFGFSVVTMEVINKHVG